MTSIYLRKYGVATTVVFSLYKTDGSALKTDAASASGDITLNRDEAGVETLDDDQFTDIGSGYKLALSATEMQAARIIVYVVDQTSPQVWLDKTFIVETYGNASAMHAFDLDTATQNVNVASQDNIDFGALQKTSLNAATPTVTVSDKTGFSLSAAGVDSILDEVVDSNAPADANSLRETINVIASATAGKLSGAGSGTLLFRDLGDTKDRVTATMDANNNRTAVVQDGT